MMTAVSLFQLTLSVRLCDYSECRKPLHMVLQCAKYNFAYISLRFSCPRERQADTCTI
jgi:hypothetical protein